MTAQGPGFNAKTDTLDAFSRQLIDALDELQERREAAARVERRLRELASDTTAHPTAVRKQLKELAEELHAIGPLALAEESVPSRNEESPANEH